jgi:NitT/TauT family transport system substrate-binding protein
MSSLKRGAALLSIAAAVAAPTVLRAQSAVKLRVIATPFDASGPVFYAKDLGYFDKAGLDVDIVTPQNPGITVSAVAGGSIDIGYINITQVELAFAKGIPLRILVPSSMSTTNQGRQGDAIMIAKNSPIKTVKDFEGKTLGTAPLKSLGDYSFNAWAAARGADPSKIKWVEIPFVACNDAVTTGRIDGSFTIEPFVTQAVAAQQQIFCHPFSSIGTRFITAAYCVTPAWADANKDVARRFAAAIHDAAVWGNKNPVASGKIVSKYSKIDEATIAAMARTPYAEALDPADLQPTIDFLVKNKLVDTGFRGQDLIYKLT